jgi:diphthine synthase
MILDTDIQQLTDLIGREVLEISRNEMEENSASLIEESKTKDIGILIGGDALTATTHISLILEAVKMGVKIRVIHGSSILTSVGETGLSPYKIGHTITLPLPEKAPPDSVLSTIKGNQEHGLHTLILLDIDTSKQRVLTANNAINILLQANETDIFNGETLVVGVARLGWENQDIRADTANILKKYEFGEPPHALLVPGKLHFHESEALKILAKCPEGVLLRHRPSSELDRLISQYSQGCRRVIGEMQINDLPQTIRLEEVKSLIKHASNYLEDGEYYKAERKATALVSVSYAEGILDALKLLGLVKFEW